MKAHHGGALGFLTNIAALRAILHRMEQVKGYRPRRYPAGEAGVTQAREHLEDAKELLGDYKGEGSD